MPAYSRTLLPWDSQPQEAVGVDWENPLARGLIFLRLPNQPSTLGGSLTATGAVGRTATALGIANTFSTSYLQSSAPVTLPFTMAAVAVVNSTAAAQTILSIGNTGAASNYWQFGVNAGGTIRAATRNTTYAAADTTSAVTAGEPFVAAAVYLSSTDRRAFLNEELSAANTTSSTPTGTTLRVGAIARNTPSDYLNGGTLLEAIWDRALSEQELDEWANNPWQLFAPRLIWVPVSAGGGGTTHATTGALTGAGSTVAGSAARTRLHPSSGVLTGPGAVVDGAAARIGSAAEHATTGALVGPGSAIDGAAAHIAIHGTSGALTGQGSVIAGTAARVAGAVTHDTSGALVGPGSLLDGIANGPAVLTTAGGGGWLPKMRRKTRKELHAERVRLGILPPDVVKAAQKAAAVVLDEPSPAKAYRADPEAANKVFLRELGATKMLPDYTRAIQIQIELQHQEDEDLMLFF